MKKIPLTHGKFAIVDDEDFEYINQWKWHTKEGKNTFYAIRTEGSGENKKRFRMHRVVMNAPDGIEVDHRDRNGVNNRKENLRLATHQQNGMNKGMQSNNKSGQTGVHKVKRTGKWWAYIKKDRKMISLGFHDLFKDAVEARIEGEKTYFGEFAINSNIKRSENE